MDTTLVTVTVLSMGMAAALSVIVWRLLRDERQRTEARVVALTELSRVPGHESPVPGRARFTDLELRTVTREPLNREPLNREPEPVNPELRTVNLFREEDKTSPWGVRAVVMVALAMVAASAILFALAATDDTPAAARTAAPAAAAPAAAAEAGVPGGIELLSLRDAPQGKAGELTITGLVHNPKSGALLSRVSVTAYAFDEKGSFLASGRALLDVTTLAPGDDSPFVVTVPVREAVARYRIGFRGEDGRVIAHVDKRQQGI